jgi:hypothetical protein
MLRHGIPHPFFGRTVLSVLVVGVALGACTSGGPAASTGASATTAAPGPSVVSASPAPASPQAGQTSTNASAPPTTSSGADPVLAAKFPKTIDRQPITNVRTFRFLELMSAIGTPKTTVDQFTAACTQAGVDPGALTFATAEVTVNGLPQVIQALRIPGGEGFRLIAPLLAAAQLRGIGAGGTARPLSVSPTHISGKSVQVATAADLTQYYYPTGDTEFVLNMIDPSTAATILGALP